MDKLNLEVLDYTLDVVNEIKTITVKDSTGQIRTLDGNIVAEKYKEHIICFTNIQVKVGSLGGLAIISKHKSKNLLKQESLNRTIKDLENQLKKLEQSDDPNKSTQINNIKDKIIKNKRELHNISGYDLNNKNIYTDINNKQGLARQRKARDYRSRG